MIYRKEDYEKDQTKLFIYFMFELIIGGTFLFLGSHFNQYFVTGLGVAICIMSLILYLVFSYRKKGEYENEQRTYD